MQQTGQAEEVAGARDAAGEEPRRGALARLPRLARPGSAFDRFLRLGMAAWATVGIALVGYALLRVLIALEELFSPLLIAAAVVYLLNPLVSLLARRGVPRLAGALVVYLAFLLLVALVLWLLVPLVTREVAGAVRDFPVYVQAIEARVNELAGRFGQRVDLNIEAGQVQGWLQDRRNQQAVWDSITGLRSLTSDVLHGLVLFVIGVIVAFYLLVDLPRLRRGLLAIVPPRHRVDLEELSSRVGRAVGGFFRGQVLVALFVGIASCIGLRIVGLPFWLLVGLTAGVFNLVPLIGPWIAGLLAVAIALVNGDPAMALWAALALLVVQQIDNHLISPNVMSRAVKLHPVVVILALLLGATFYGILGMLVAVPLVAAAKICFLFLWSRHVDYGEDLLGPAAAGD
jgi:predicted PurR-regulated permease PerM